jgi:hypothetical protein
MTNQQLYDLLSQSLQNGVFSLQVNQLGSPNCDLVASSYLPTNTLRLNQGATLTPSGEGYLVVGTGVDLPFSGIPGINVMFLIDGLGNAQFTLVANPPTTWLIPQGFPPMGKSVYDSLGFSSQPQMTLDTTHAGDPGFQGIYFHGLLNIAQFTAGLSELLGISTNEVAGSITMSRNGAALTSFSLTSTTPASAEVGFLSLNGITVNVTYQKSTNPYSRKNIALPFLGISAQLPFSAQGNEYSIGMLLKLTQSSGPYFFSSDITELIQATLDEMSTLLGGVNPGNSVPPDFKLDSLLKVNLLSVTLAADLSNPILDMGIQFQNASPWTIMHLDASNTDLIADDVTLQFSVANPITDPSPLLEVNGTIRLSELGALTLYASAFSEWSLGAFMPQGSVILLTDIVELFLGAPSGLPEIKIYTLSFSLSSSQYSVELKAGFDWDFSPLPLCIQEVDLAIAYVPPLRPEGQGVLTGSAVGYLSVSTADIALIASYPGADGAWIFEGRTEEGTSLSMEDLLSDLAYTFGTDTTLPAFLEGFTISDLGTTFNTLTKDFTFHCTGNFVLYDTPVAITVDVKILQQSNGTYSKTFAGRIVFSGFQFDLVFDTDYSKTYFIANYYNVDGGPVVVKNLIAGISTSVSEYIPEGLTFNLKDALFAWESVGGVNKFLFAMDWDFGVNLSSLPLVGRYFRTDETLDLAFQVMVASDAFSADDVTRLNALVPPNTITFPAQGIAEGLNLITTFRLGGEPTPLTLPVGINSQSGALQTTGTTWSGDTQPLWYNLQKTFGPVYFNRVGVLYRSDNSRLYFLLDASLNTAGMSLALTGLNISTSITDFTDLAFGLDGLALDYSSGPVQIGGAFLGSIQMVNGVATTLYTGAAIAEMEGLGIAAMGSYADVDGNTSLFIYGELDAPIVVQPWLTITGISGGFGYNRSLNVPTLDSVMSFPLVEQAMSMSGGGDAKSMQQMLTDMNTYLRAEVGQYWLAAGLKFNTFKILDSFVLLTAAFGNKFQLNLIGISTLMMPPDLPGGVQPLAELQLAVLATFDWDSGYLGVSGQLTQNSFLLSRNVKLTGGFAVCTWFKGENKGNFVATVGGYHPQYKVPNGYPVVPRLGFNWQLSDNLTLKGESYLALTSGAVMAGMNLTATWQQGSIKAWFSTSADFLIAWKPYYYDAKLAITVGAQYTFDHLGIRKTISADVGASLHLWGPDFSGLATVDLSVISFDIAFGAAKPTGPKAISNEEFVTSFIPATPVGVVPSGGIVGSVMVTSDENGSSTQVNVLNPAQGVISVTSFIPAQYIAWQSSSNSYEEIFTVPAQLGISPMGIAASGWLTCLNISLEYGTSRNNATWVNIREYFDAEAVYGNAPTALWGGKLTPKLNDPEFVKNVLTGLLLRPKPLTIANPLVIPKANLSVSAEACNTHYYISGAYTETFLSGDDNESLINSTILSSSVVTKRDGLLASMGLDTPINLTDTVANMFLDSPQALTSTLY